MAKKDPNKPGRIKTLRLAYTRTKQVDPKIGPVLLGTFLVVAVVAFVALYFLLGQQLLFPIIAAVLFGVLAVLIVFGRRAQKAAYSQMEGKPGAGIATLGVLKRGWKVEEKPVAFNRHQDVITRVVGPPGIVLLGEGNHNRLKPLMASERKKHARVAADFPIHEVYVGHGEGEVPIDRLVKHVRKLGKEVQPAQMTDILQRLRALDAQRANNMPLPKGPMPTRQNMRGMRQQNMRGR